MGCPLHSGCLCLCSPTVDSPYQLLLHLQGPAMPPPRTSTCLLSSLSQADAMTKWHSCLGVGLFSPVGAPGELSSLFFYFF